jgi:hypothetical protein
MKAPDSSNNKHASIGLLISIVITVLAVSANDLLHNYPFLTWLLPSLLIVLGAPSLLGGIILYARYSDIYDYESTAFLGKQTNGKEVRRTLMTIEIIGGWCVILGIIIFAFSNRVP